MADRQPVDHLAEIETLLRAELSVEPSHEFLPRVRERIRTQPAPSRWRSSWIIAPLAAAAAVVLAVAITFRPETPPPPVEVAASRPIVPPVPNPHLRAPRYGGQAESPASRSALRRASRVPNTEYRTPNAGVLIDPRQREALLSFVRLANQGALTGESFKLTTQPPAVIEEQVKAIVVDPVAVSPIAPRGVLPSELERK